MSFFSTIEGRVTVPISFPERAQDVATGIERWLQKSRIRDVHWKDNVLNFTGDYLFRLDRLWNAKCTQLDGVGPSFLKFEDEPHQVVIEYKLTFQLSRYLLTTAAFCVPAVYASGGDLRFLLLAVPIVALIQGGLWRLTVSDFRSNLQIAASRAMTDAAVREMHALQTPG